MFESAYELVAEILSGTVKRLELIIPDGGCRIVRRRTVS